MSSSLTSQVEVDDQRHQHDVHDDDNPEDDNSNVVPQEEDFPSLRSSSSSSPPTSSSSLTSSLSSFSSSVTSTPSVSAWGSKKPLPFPSSMKIPFKPKTHVVGGYASSSVNSSVDGISSPSSSSLSSSLSVSSPSTLPSLSPSSPLSTSTITSSTSPSSSSFTDIILDSGAFIVGSNLTSFGPNCRYFTIPNVESELKDEASRHRFATFPYVLAVKLPSPQCLQMVTDFSKKTGDYYSLSSTDIGIIALGLQLEMEKNGMKNVKTQPKVLKEEEFKKLAEKNNAKSKENTKENTGPQEEKESENNTEEDSDALPMAEEEKEIENVPSTSSTSSPSDSSFSSSSSPLTNSPFPLGSDGEGEWITTSTLSHHNSLHSSHRPLTSSLTSSSLSPIALITTDYTMQNVILQMGLRCVTLHGLSITSIRQWVLKCHSCFALCRDLSREFCAQCGHHTMIRVTVIVDNEGGVTYFHGNRHFNLRGTKYSIPAPKGGRNGNKLKFSEDVMRQFKAKENHYRVKDRDGQRDKDKDAENFLFAGEFGNQKKSKGQYEEQFGYGKKNPNVAKGHRKKK